MLKRNRRGDAEDFDEEISVLPDDERKSLLSSNNNKSQSSKIKLKNEDQEMEIPLNRYKEPTVEVEIDSQTESLQTLSLRYNVPISELKRCNQIMNDAEFYGLKKIKIPVNPNTVMAGLLIPGLNVEGSDTAVATPSNGGKTDQGWVIESNVLGASSVYSSPLSDESDSALSTTATPTLRADPASVHRNGTTGLHGDSLLNMTPSREAKKAKKFFRSVDKEVASVREKSVRIQSLADEEEVDVANISGDGETDSMLISASSDPKPSAFSSKTSKFACWLCFGLTVISVALILWFARYEFQVIQNEHHEPPPHHNHQHESGQN